jgi:hypothetical protein
MRRRDFVLGLGAGAILWSNGARAQPSDRVRRIGALIYRRAASYVDRILKGANPAELAVQMPSKYEVTVNLRTARALGLNVPRILVARADELID